MRPMRLYGSESEMMAWVRSALSSQTLRIAGHAKLHLGKEEEAVTWLRRSIEANRNYPASRFYLAAALAHLGRLPEARSEAEAGLALNPVFSISRVRAITQRVTIRLFSPDANTSTTDCARPEPPINDHDPPTRRDHGRRRRYSAGAGARAFAGPPAH
jgi:tetratricopeptide (TPR) repeat protein